LDVTETEWDACADPEPMLALLRDKARHRRPSRGMRLFAAAWAASSAGRALERPAEVLRLAETIYAERSFELLPILADVLTERAGPHALGCHRSTRCWAKE
jgi:hypothetical protein